MRRNQLQWVAGPIQYWSSGNVGGGESSLWWEFVGATGAGTLCRRRLRYTAVTRTFSASALELNLADLHHSRDVLKFYKHAAVMVADLPKGDLATKLRAMLPPAELAAAAAMSVNAGVGWK